MYTSPEQPKKYIVEKDGQIAVIELVTKVRAIVQTSLILLFLRHFSEPKPHL